MATQVERTASARRRLMQAAIELFAEQGVRGASVAAIGARAGMSRGAVNFHLKLFRTVNDPTLHDQLDIDQLEARLAGQRRRELTDFLSNFQLGSG